MAARTIEPKNLSYPHPACTPSLESGSHRRSSFLKNRAATRINAGANPPKPSFSGLNCRTPGAVRYSRDTEISCRRCDHGSRLTFPEHDRA
ncbi:hypothetical protein ebA5799 [Aromatoleum aromaticum EbN1]|uniref:Uncharacterized protein n=1 Tax=Aromatoleum aromaticum (strain DSM 19018 / LMG 30748 / EbN1) TaxID=76114 RepID=Q5NZU7_AROAE|nr:hypothetical protein ebA5799 [Aromatoleum aromaticum EbN1]